VFNPGPDNWDLDTLSLVSKLMNRFHGVNGTAASDTHWLSYMKQAAVVISSGS
jgi:hypothetical protein